MSPSELIAHLHNMQVARMLEEKWFLPQWPPRTRIDLRSKKSKYTGGNWTNKRKALLEMALKRQIFAE